MDFLIVKLRRLPWLVILATAFITGMVLVLAAAGGCKETDDGPGGRQLAVKQSVSSGAGGGSAVGSEFDNKISGKSGGEAGGGSVDASVVSLSADEAASRACDAIMKGDFASAKASLESAAYESKKVRLLKNVVSDYDYLEAKRQELYSETYHKHLEKLEEIKAEGEITAASDVNDINDAFAAVLKVKRYANEKQEKELIESPFVQGLIKAAKQKGSEFEREGKWIEAYSNGYFWLEAMFEDDKSYEKKTERLMELASIESDLMDSSCVSSIERHEGIKPEMFVNSIRALDFSYVQVPDYNTMAEAAIQRCSLLGVVLAESNEELAFSAEKGQLDKWQKGLEEIEASHKEPFSNVTRDELIKMFYEVLALNEETLKVADTVVIAQFTSAAFEKLDPYTNLIWPWEVRDFQKNITQEFTGVGIEISKRTGDLKVNSLIPDTPAYNSGLDAGDIIVAINGEKVTKEMDIQCAVSKITGPKGTEVVLTVKHEDSDEVEDITIVRDRIIVPTIKSWLRVDKGKWNYMIDEDNGIGYLRITNFTSTTADLLEKTLDRMEDNGLRGLIIDLRNNTGGLLNSAAEVVDMFVDEGLIVRSQPRYGFSTYEKAQKRGTHPSYPIVILINGGSASASEIVAGAMQDAKFSRATLVGERTYGKGSVQTISGVSGEGSQLKYTMAYYYLPSNQRVESRYLAKREDRTDWGIAPDVEVELKPVEIEKMVKSQRDNEIVAREDHDKDNPLVRHDKLEMIDSDPQLAVGLIVVRAKLACQGGGLVFGDYFIDREADGNDSEGDVAAAEEAGAEAAD